MNKLIEQWELAGGPLAVLKDGEIVLARGYGNANLEDKELDHLLQADTSPIDPLILRPPFNTFRNIPEDGIHLIVSIPC
jgi:hypothetical protein